MAAETSDQNFLWFLHLIDNYAETLQLTAKACSFVSKLAGDEMQLMRGIVRRFRLSQEIAHRNLRYSISARGAVDKIDSVERLTP